MSKVGTLSETDYQTVKNQYLSDQLLLSDYADSDETLIAVVRKPGNSNIEEYVDEHWPELGMPEYALNRFRELRAGYRTNSAVEDAHNKAFRDANLEQIYREHLTTESAEKRLREAELRLNRGEDLTFVCFEKENQSCHRHILIDVLRERMSKETQFTFVV